MDVRSIPLVGTGAGLLGASLDLVLNSGEILIWLATLVLTDPGALLGIVSTLNRLAPRVEWLPESLLGDVAIVLLVAMLVSSAIRLLQRRRQNA